MQRAANWEAGDLGSGASTASANFLSDLGPASPARSRRPHLDQEGFSRDDHLKGMPVLPFCESGAPLSVSAPGLPGGWNPQKSIWGGGGGRGQVANQQPFWLSCRTVVEPVSGIEDAPRARSASPGFW